MKKKSFLIVTGLIASITLQAQKINMVEVNYVSSDGTDNTNNIKYQPGQLLAWGDFRGRPVAGGNAVALTSAGFGVKLKFRTAGNTSELVISVSCSFSKKGSWVMPGSKSAYILNHEQKHFDIAFINTLLFIQNLREAHFTRDNYQSVIEKIYNETAEAMSRIQDQYDAETAHSMIPEKQALWDEKIRRQMLLSVKEN